MATLHALLQVLSQPAECLVNYLDSIAHERWGGEYSASNQNTNSLDIYLEAERTPETKVSAESSDRNSKTAPWTSGISLVTAPPGGGKTFYLRMVAARMARRSSARIRSAKCLCEDAWIPFFIPPTESLTGATDLVTRIAAAQIKSLQFRGRESLRTAAMLEASIRAGKAFIIIDHDFSTLDDSLLKELNGSGCRVFVSCRYVPRESESELGRLARYVKRTIALQPFGSKKLKSHKLANCPAAYQRIRAVCGPAASPYAVVAIAKLTTVRLSDGVKELFSALAHSGSRAQSPPDDEFRKGMADAMFAMFKEARITQRSAEFTMEGFVESTNRKSEALWDEACARGVVVRSGRTHPSKGDSYYTTTDPRFLPWLLAAGFVAAHSGPGPGLITAAKKLLDRQHKHCQQMLFDYLPTLLECEERTKAQADEWRAILVSRGNPSVWRRVIDFLNRWRKNPAG